MKSRIRSVATFAALVSATTVTFAVIAPTAFGATFYSLTEVGYWASGINDKGEVVGSILSTTNIALHPFVYSGGVITDPGSFGVTGNAMPHAFIYEGGKMTDLNDLLAPASQWTLQYAVAINNSGAIVGWGLTPSGKTAGFLLNPVVVPTLAIKVSGTNLIISWPTSATNFSLFQNPDFSAPDWVKVMKASTVVNGQNFLAIPILGAQQFFRLSR
jgi:probable HAF family extracellular repeat protein